MKNLKRNLFISFLVLLAGAGILVYSLTHQKQEIKMDVASNELDLGSKSDLCNAMWLKSDCNIAKDLPSEVQKNLELSVNKPEGLGKNTATMINDVGTSFLPFVKRYPEMYSDLIKISQKGLSPTQVYNIPGVMGQDYFKGYAGMNNIKELTFPADYDAHLDYQAGWYFFAGNFTDQNGNPVDILVNFFHRSMYPLDIANKMGLTEANNQIVEVQLGLSLADKGIHVQGSNPTIAATTGLVKFSANPFSVQVGKNIAQSQQPNELFPMKIQVSDPEQNLNIDLTLEKANPVLLEGKNGQAPSMYNLGTWYYSFPNIKTTGTVSLGDDTRDLSGKMWMDNQWTAGIMPAGYADNIFIRALSNILNWYKGQTPQAWGWDWVEAQFDDNTGVTISSMHSVQSKDLNNLGENPPGDVTRDAYGKYINADGSAEDLNGKLTINKWVKSPASGAWFPNGWVLDFPSKNLNFTMTPTVDGQLFQTKSSAEFREGGVIITGKRDGQDIAGVGFGEGVGYAGEDYYYKTFFGNMGIQDTPENRDLYSPQVPGFWLVVESLLLYAIPLALVVYIIVLIIKKLRKPHK